MTDITLNGLKADMAAAEAERAEADRLTRKRAALVRLADIQKRLTTFVDTINERREQLKADRTTAKNFLRAIEANADDEDLEIEDIEQLLAEIEDFRNRPPRIPLEPSTYAPAAPPIPPAPVSKSAEFVTVSMAQLDTMIADAIRANVSPSSIRRGSRVGSRIA